MHVHSDPLVSINRHTVQFILQHILQSESCLFGMLGCTDSNTQCVDHVSAISAAASVEILSQLNAPFSDSAHTTARYVSGGIKRLLQMQKSQHILPTGFFHRQKLDSEQAHQLDQIFRHACNDQGISPMHLYVSLDIKGRLDCHAWSYQNNTQIDIPLRLSEDGQPQQIS